MYRIRRQSVIQRTHVGGPVCVPVRVQRGPAGGRDERRPPDSLGEHSDDSPLSDWEANRLGRLHSRELQKGPADFGASLFVPNHRHRLDRVHDCEVSFFPGLVNIVDVPALGHVVM